MAAISPSTAGMDATFHSLLLRELPRHRAVRVQGPRRPERPPASLMAQIINHDKVSLSAGQPWCSLPPRMALQPLGAHCEQAASPTVSHRGHSQPSPHSWQTTLCLPCTPSRPSCVAPWGEVGGGLGGGHWWYLKRGFLGFCFFDEDETHLASLFSSIRSVLKASGPDFGGRGGWALLSLGTRGMTPMGHTKPTMNGLRQRPSIPPPLIVHYAPAGLLWGGIGWAWRSSGSP